MKLIKHYLRNRNTSENLSDNLSSTSPVSHFFSCDKGVLEVEWDEIRGELNVRTVGGALQLNCRASNSIGIDLK